MRIPNGVSRFEGRQNTDGHLQSCTSRLGPVSRDLFRADVSLFLYLGTTTKEPTQRESFKMKKE